MPGSGTGTPVGVTGFESSLEALYIALRKALRDPSGGGAETASSRWTLQEKKDAINQAIVDVQDIVRVPYIDESILLVDGTFDYALPSNFSNAKNLHEIWLEQSGAAWTPVFDGWTIKDNNGTPRLYVESVWEADKNLRLVYDGKPEELGSDSDVTLVPKDFILTRARAYLHYQASEDASGNDSDWHLKRGDFWWNRSVEMFNELVMQNNAKHQGRIIGAMKWDISEE